MAENFKQQQCEGVDLITGISAKRIVSEDAGEDVVLWCWNCFFLLLFIWFFVLIMDLHLICFIELMVLLRYQLNLYKKLPCESQLSKNPLWTEIGFHGL